MSPGRVIAAVIDDGLRARLVGTRPLTLARADAERDLPGHVRAGSAIRRWGGRLVVVQDDVQALALWRAETNCVTALVLPPGADGRRSFSEARGNKALKMDLEACATLPDGRLVALGSGSTPRRQRLVVIDEAGHVRFVDGDALYAGLRGRVDFAGSELNVEGAVVVDGALRLFQRGNGAPGGGRAAVNATGDLELASFIAWLDGGPTPALERVQEFDLGAARGVPFGFTDATALPDGRVGFLACAEASPDTFRDGALVGSRFGIIAGDEVRIADIVDEAGAATPYKLEGIDWLGERPDGGWELVVVADMDDPDVASVVGTLRVDGPPSSLRSR